MVVKDKDTLLSDAMFLHLEKVDVEVVKGTWDSLKMFIDEKFQGQRASTFVMLYHLVALGIYQDKKFILPYEETITAGNLRFLRIFDEEKECFVWRNEDDPIGVFRLRYRLDGKSINQKSDVIVAKQLLWGTKIIEAPEAGVGWKLLMEDRGIQILIHQKLLPDNFKISPENRLWLVTKNYVDYTDIYQASYVDSRFVKIVDMGGQEG